MAVGPILGGVLIEWIDWRAVFWVNLPICALALLLTALFVPESRSATMRTLDPLGQALAIIALGSLVFALIEGPGLGWSSPTTLGCLVLAVMAAIIFLRWEGRHPDPFIDLRFFHSVPFSTAAIVAVCAYAGYGAFLFLMSLYLQEQRGLSAIHTGIMLIPIAVVTLIASPLSGRAVARYGTRPSLLVAGIGLLAGSLMLVGIQDTTPLPYLAAAFAVFGIGFAVVNAPITTSAVSGMPTSRAGAAAAVASTSRQVGVSIGVALAGSLTGIGTASTVVGGLADSIEPMWWLTAGLAVVIICLALISTTRRAHRTEQDVARGLIEPESGDGAAAAPH